VSLPLDGSGGVAVQAMLDVPDRDPEKPIFWEFSGNHAIRDGNWKLVAERTKDWELYDIAADRSETSDLASKTPALVQELAAKYNAWATRAGAQTHEKSKKMKPSTPSQLFDLQQIVQAE